MVTGLCTFLNVLHGFSRFHRFDYFSLVPCRLLILQHYTHFYYIHWVEIVFVIAELHTTLSVSSFCSVRLFVRFFDLLLFLLLLLYLSSLSLFLLFRHPVSLFPSFFLHYTLSHSFHSLVRLSVCRWRYIYTDVLCFHFIFSAAATKPNRTILVWTIRCNTATKRRNAF